MSRRRDSTAAARTGSARRRDRPDRRQRCGRHRGNAGMATLEWLLIIAAAGGFAAAMTAGLDHLITDQTASPPADTPAAHTAARIRAARINDRSVEALTAVHAATSVDDTQAAVAASARLERLKHACEDLPRLYSETLRGTSWHWQPIALPQPPTTPDGAQTENEPGTQGETENGSDPGTGGEPAADGRWVCSLNGQSS